MYIWRHSCIGNYVIFTLVHPFIDGFCAARNVFYLPLENLFILPHAILQMEYVLCFVVICVIIVDASTATEMPCWSRAASPSDQLPYSVRITHELHEIRSSRANTMEFTWNVRISSHLQPCRSTITFSMEANRNYPHLACVSISSSENNKDVRMARNWIIDWPKWGFALDKNSYDLHRVNDLCSYKTRIMTWLKWLNTKGQKLEDTQWT